MSAGLIWRQAPTRRLTFFRGYRVKQPVLAGDGECPAAQVRIDAGTAATANCAWRSARAALHRSESTAE